MGNPQTSALQNQITTLNSKINTLQAQLTAANATIAADQVAIADLTAKLAAVPPTPPQTIDLFTVSAGSIVAGQSVVVNWATSNATVVRLNGATVGASGSQSFTPSANATYTLQADGAVATVIAGPLAVAVTQPAPAPQPATNGVLLALSLTKPEHLGPLRTDRSQWLDPAFAHSYSPGNATAPVIDALGMRFDKPSQTGPNWGGEWGVLLPREFGPASLGLSPDLFVRLRIRWNDAMLNTRFDDASAPGAGSQKGLKAFDLAAGGISTTNELGKIVLATYYQARFWQTYQYEDTSGGGDAGLGEIVYAADGVQALDYKLQNALACLYSQVRQGLASGCMYMHANEPITVQMGANFLGVSPLNPAFWDWRYRLWMAYAGQPAVLLHDWHPDVPGYFPLCAPVTTRGYGKIFIFPYSTGQDPNQVHDLASVWFQGLAVNDQYIPEANDYADFIEGESTTVIDPPLVEPPPPVVAPLPSAYPAWRAGAPLGQLIEIPNTALALLPGTFEGQINAWNGMARLGSRWYGAAQGGHGEAENNVVMLDLAADSPKFAMVDPGTTDSTLITHTRYYGDGKPQSRHDYQTAHGIEAEHSPDGDERVILATCSAAYSLTMDNNTAYGNAPDVEAFNTTKGVWEHGWPPCPFYYLIPTVARDPRNGDIYVQSGGDNGAGNDLAVLRAKTKTWEIVHTDPFYPSPDRIIGWLNVGSLVDGKRGRLVCLTDGGPYDTRGLRLNIVDLATARASNLFVTGLPGHTPWRYPIVHDLDNDRYVYLRWASAGTPYSGTVEFWGINPDTSVATLITTTTHCPEVTIETRAEYFPALGGIAYLPRYESNVLFMATR